jgi:proline racemase
MTAFRRVLQVVDSHTEAEPTRVVVAGLPRLRAPTVAGQRDELAAEHDELRRIVVLEPRGHDAIVAAYLLPPVTAEADAAVVFCNDAGYLGMCGHGAIGVVTTLLATGAVRATEPETRVRLDTPVGLVTARARVAGGRATSVALRNVPSFADRLDAIVPVDGFGKLKVDVAWGGNWFAFVEAAALGLAVRLDALDALMDAARRIRAALAAAGLRGRDPAGGGEAAIDHVKLWEPCAAAGAHGARALTLCPGRAWDRSPCGTGTSAKLALLHARGALPVGGEIEYRSILDTKFRGRILAETRVGDRPAILPEIDGSAWITAFAQLVVEDADPLGR